MASLHFHVKEICWSAYEQKSPILLQEENGPCPLIALVNTLVLTNDVEKRTLGMEGPGESTQNGDFFGANAASSSSDAHQMERPKMPDLSPLRSLLQRNVGATVAIAQILSSLGDLLLDIPTVDTQTVNGLLENLPLLHTGLDVNPNLTTGTFDPDDLASRIFSAFGLNFLHGWCREPEGNPSDSVFSRYQTFDALQEYLLTSPEAESEKHVEQWIHENATQLTAFGLESIDTRMRPDSLAIFFRNNHFSSLYKAQNHGLYLLITDTAFVKRPNYVWQSLNSVSGKDDLYFAGDFTPLLDGADYDETVDENLRLAKELQEEEDMGYAKMLQKNYERRAEKTSKSSSGDSGEIVKGKGEGNRGLREPATKKKSPKKESGKKKDSCVVM